MSINLTDELHAATTKGKLAAARQVYLDGDEENLQQIGDKTHQLEQAVKDISVSGGASTANAVNYDNSNSGLGAITAQAAIDELAVKDKSQDVEIAKKVDASDFSAEQQRVDAELDKKVDKSNIAQDFGDSEEKVVSQAALPFRYIQSEEFIFAQVDAEQHLLFGIQLDGTPVFGKKSAVEEGLQSQVNLLAERVATIIGDDDTTNVIDTLNELKNFFANIENTQKLTDILLRLDTVQTVLDAKVDKEEGKSLIDDEIKERFGIIENEEFLEAKLDGEGKILEATTSDGKKQINLPTYMPSANINGAAEVKTIDNEEFLDLKLDRENHILEGITRDGDKVLPLPIKGNPTIEELRKDIANVREQARKSYLEIEFDDATGDINAVIGDYSTITDVNTDEDGNIYLEEDMVVSTEDTLVTMVGVDENTETALFNK